LFSNCSRASALSLINYASQPRFRCSCCCWWDREKRRKVPPRRRQGAGTSWSVVVHRGALLGVSFLLPLRHPVFIALPCLGSIVFTSLMLRYCCAFYCRRLAWIIGCLPATWLYRLWLRVLQCLLQLRASAFNSVSRASAFLSLFSHALLCRLFLCPRSTAFGAKYSCTVSFCGPSKPKCPSLNGSAGVHVLSRSSTALFFCFMFAVTILNLFVWMSRPLFSSWSLLSS